MLPVNWMPSKVRRDPRLLLHKANPTFPLGPFDGKNGIILDGSDSFIVTPNSYIICRPPLGVNREVYMRENFRYGQDDPLQWPQAYVEQFPHLACIRWIAPASPNDPFHPLYRGLTKYDFVECDPDSLVEGVGHLRYSTFLKIQAACKVVIESMNSVDGSAPVSRSMRGHLNVIELLLGRLHALPTSFLRVCLTFAETQCVALELRAFVEYMTVFKPLMDSPETDVPAMPVDESLVGAYIQDATVLQRFFKAGIPVWRIVDMKNLPGTRVDSLTEFATSPWPQGPCTLRLPSVFVGSSRDPWKYSKIQEHVLHSCRRIDPFALASPIILGRPDVPLTAASSSTSRYSPYHKNARPQSGKPHQLMDPQHPLLPLLIEPWRRGLLAVDANPSRCHSSGRPQPTAIPRESQYAFPRPDIIATVNTEEKVNSFLISWLRLQTPLFARLTVTERVPPNLYHQEWRTVLALGFLHSAGESGGLATRWRQEVTKIMEGYAEFPLHVDNNASTAFWRGKAYETLTREERMEICWELSEVNFRCEFRALHRQATVNASDGIRALDVFHCFPDGRQLPGQIDVGSANYGLAHHLWLQRAPYIFAMKKLMKTWDGNHPAFLDVVKSTGWTEDEFLSIENSIAAHYCDMFFLYFGRAPVLPRQLAHQTSESYVPEPRDRVATTRSGVYLDIEDLV
ncbi:uncharacterized protein EV420DRAFT_1770014 [Desarmillaria tabescens]|uniref:Uncharacterized protein n=1 Tax=Armillaria tabescens TaxID=1929756 RepID=A0AA39J777_ARMTA|nr:uncharacterized protein EV420DRAFT_1770014 [Desarmillaria tabescens]KAK0437440.1 hypothetical protein EV420DRAFT_1770014 [Desarmillaria tabescens]